MSDTAPPKLTPAEKRKATLAAKAAQELEENIAFQNESRNGRKAKKDAQKNAIWKVDQPSARKRSASTAEVSENPTKKAKEMGAASTESDVEAAEDQAPAKAKSKTHSTKSARKYAAPTIINSDNDAAPEPPVKPVRRIDFTKLPGNGKSKAVKGSKTVSASNGKSNAAKVKTKAKTTTKAQRAKIVADSASDAEDETASSEDSDEDVDSVEMSDNDDGLVDADDFIAEVPQMISARSKLQPKTSAASLDKTSVITDRQSKKDNAEALFDSDKESDIGVIAPITKRKSAGKAKVKPRDADSRSDDSMADAPARRPINSDIEMHDVSIPAQHRRRRSSTMSHHSSGMSDAPKVSRSRRSSMGSAYSSEGHHSVPPSEMESDAGSEEDIEAIVEAPMPKKKTRKVSAARQKQADAEKPDIKPAVIAAAARNKAPVTTSTREESSWDISAQLVLPAPNKDIGLTVQHDELQEVLRDTMDVIKIFMLFEDAYPLMVSRAGRPHPQTDPGFGAILAPIPLDRMNITRGKLKRSAVNCVPAFFELAALTPAEVKVRVEELLKDHRYIFASTAGKLKLDAPFRHGSIRFIIKEEIFSNTSFVTQNINRFPARLPKKPNERELPCPMVALAATAVYAALVEYRATGRRQPIAFTEDAYEETYRNHMQTLERARNDTPKSLHQILHGLFTEVAESDKVVHTASGSSSTLIQLVDLPDSD
ncbi:hypothetical protein B0H12DRAFT_1232084 [Mycena haematopus]|nr:hypothetical protein B0H12DRAFT_1232084 [Mycena haematopus]